MKGLWGGLVVAIHPPPASKRASRGILLCLFPLTLLFYHSSTYLYTDLAKETALPQQNRDTPKGVSGTVMYVRDGGIVCAPAPND
jgi:hypothetical protein